MSETNFKELHAGSKVNREEIRDTLVVYHQMNQPRYTVSISSFACF